MNKKKFGQKLGINGGPGPRTNFSKKPYPKRLFSLSSPPFLSPPPIRAPIGGEQP